MSLNMFLTISVDISININFSLAFSLDIPLHIMTAFENQTPLTLTFCDVSKAFDHVWIRGLIYKPINSQF